MGEVVDPNRLRGGGDNSLRGGLVVCAILNCRNQPTNKCPICSLDYCYEHIKSHFHPSEFPPIQKEKED
jgi:hypothetical protein